MGERVERALVVGAGIGGLTAAAALAGRGVRTDVVEIRPRTTGTGVGIALPGNGLRALATIGAHQPCLDQGFGFDRWEWFDETGRPTVTMPTGTGGNGIPPSNGIARGKLLAILTTAADEAGAAIAYETTVAELIDTPDGVDVTFTDGRSATYDLVVGFDGIHSATRQRCFGRLGSPDATGVTVWRLVAPRPAHLTCAHMFQGPTSVVGLIPMSAAELYLFHVTEDLGPSSGDATGHADHVDQVRESLRGFGAEVADVRRQIDADTEIVCSPVAEVVLPGPWSRGRVIVCGDAAHASMPNLAQGAGMAIEDAVVLAEVVTSDVDLDVAFASFMARRYDRCKFVQDVSRLIARNQASQRGTPRDSSASDADRVGFAQIVADELNKPI